MLQLTVQHSFCLGLQPEPVTLVSSHHFVALLPLTDAVGSDVILKVLQDRLADQAMVISTVQLAIAQPQLGMLAVSIHCDSAIFGLRQCHLRGIFVLLSTGYTWEICSCAQYACSEIAGSVASL